jgi:glycerol kinase
VRETTALGAAIAAGFAVGVWKEFDELKEINREGRTYFKPKISRKKADRMYSRWNKAVQMSKGWSGDEEDGSDVDAEEGGEQDQVEGRKVGAN